MKCKLLLVLLWLCATGVSAQHLTVKNYQKKVHPGLTAITMELYRDQNPISNVDWMEYLYWLEQIYGKEPADLKTLYFFLPEGNIETWYGFSCFAEWR